MAARRQQNDDDVDNAIGDMELSKLQNQYRILEGVRKAESEDSQNEIRKQNSAIAKLRQDNEMLTREMQLSEGAQDERSSKSEQIIQHRTRLNELEADLASTKAESADLDEEIKKKRKEADTKRKSVVALQSASNPSAIQRQIKTIENRLQTALNKYDLQLTQNAKMREVIDHLKQEREAFDGIHKKLERELTDVKKQMADVIEKSNQAYEARNEAQSKITALKEKNEKEVAQYNMELKELTRVLEHDRKLKTFMGIKGQDRAKELERTGRMSVIRKTVTSDKDKKPEEAVKSFEEAFAKIREATGIQEIDKLVDRFIEVEDQNFSLFNYVNELNTEIEMLQEKIANVKSDIENFNRQGETMDIQRKNAMKDLEEQLQTAEKQANAYQEKHQTSSSTLDQLKIGIDSLFGKIKCDKADISGQLGNAIIADANIMLYLGCIEQRANELLQLQTLLDIQATQKWERLELELREKADDGEAVDLATTLGPKPRPTGLLGVGPQAATTNIAIQPPSTEADYESDDGLDDADAKPLTHAELRAKILQQGATKRDQGASMKVKSTSNMAKLADTGKRQTK